ncbi:MAG: RagB/SusD family nutrient uptake outer membrane protein [Bacteroidales bacterium]|nr:RagB/SusD family nutrient uptake outer membrane protein [Bacteroidales bacterium]
MKIYNKIIATLVTMIVILTSCTKDLDTEPLDPDLVSAASIFDDEDAYLEFLAKLYAGLTLTGQQGPWGDRDVPAPPDDEGMTSFMRLYWSLQEISTDEAENAWNDINLIEFSAHIWSDQSQFVEKLYQRIYLNLTFCNEYIRIVSDRVGDLSGDLQQDVRIYIAEARFLRALYYWFTIDIWGNVPFVTDANATGAFLPEQITRARLFDYIESELKAISSKLLPPNDDPQYYARANRAAAWALLARLYLNSEVYLGEGNGKFTECIAYCDSIINAGYTLHDDYRELFLADNHNCTDEIIFPIAEDGLYTQSYGGNTYIIHAACSSDDDLEHYMGIYGGPSQGGWSGNRCTEAFTSIFDDTSGETDQRAIFYTDSQTETIIERDNFSQGYLCTKFRNVTSEGVRGQSNEFPDTDFPLFRLGDIYLTYAEAVLRGGSGGNMNTALGYINELRERAYGDNSGNISMSELTLDFIIDERARELYWETTRRTDLIRFDLFTTNDYIWEWKGNIAEGRATDPRNNLLPIPAFDLALNPYLDQNLGY